MIAFFVSFYISCILTYTNRPLLCHKEQSAPQEKLVNKPCKFTGEAV